MNIKHLEDVLPDTVKATSGQNVFRGDLKRLEMPSTRRPSEVPRPKMITPRAEGEEARKGCAELAVLIAGSEAPSWFVRHLEYAAIRVAVMRNVDKTAHKARYKSELKNA